MSTEGSKPQDECASALERLFCEPPARSDWLTPAFLAQVPAANVTAIIGKLEPTISLVDEDVPRRTAVGHTTDRHVEVRLALEEPHGVSKAVVVLRRFRGGQRTV